LEDDTVLFFLLSLILSLLLTGAIFAGLLKALQVNWERKNRRPISYLNPLLLTLAFLILTTFLAVPRLLDTMSLISGDYKIEEIQIDQGDIGWNSLQNGKRHFIYNQWKYPLQLNRKYRISYTPRSYFIIDLHEISEADDAGQ
jgi:hypothetical protein